MGETIIETARAAWRPGMRVAAPAPGVQGTQPLQMRRHNPASGLPLTGDGRRDVRGNSWGTLDAQLEC